ncbi:MAG: hypothetical protein ACJ8H8_17010 [Geminicoccaceae bacterium]
MRQAHAWLAAIARHLEAASEGDEVALPAGREVRRRVESCLDELAKAVAAGQIATWLHPAVEHLGTVLRRLGDGLYHCYDVPGLPRTNNDLEHFYRQVKAGERRITGRKRADSFVVRVGGFAVYAAAAKDEDEGTLLRRLTGVPATVWQAERAVLRANQERQTTMHRFRLRRDAYLADLEARWDHLTLPP